MLESKFEDIIKIEIIKEKMIPKTFSEMINKFDKLFENNSFIDKSIKIKDYFGENIGKNKAREKLLKGKIINENWLNESIGDFKGLYIFIHNNIPIYFGISRGVINRVIQHIKGKNHFQATLAYNIGIIYYKLLNGKEYYGKRENFNFEKYVEPIKNFLLNQNISFINVANDEELYLLEIYCSIKYKTILNNFETH